IRAELGGTDKPILFGDHHESHAASAFYPSPFEDAAILTMDGVGEWATSSIGVGRGSILELLKQQRFPHSVGLLYSAFTYFTGFRVNSGEYKVMGLAPYGEPKYVSAIRDHVVDIHADGSIRLNLEYFDFTHGLTMTGEGVERRGAWKPQAAMSPDAAGHAAVAPFADGMKGSYLGPAFGDDAIADWLRASGGVGERVPRPQLAGRVAELLAEGLVIGLVQG